jgi:hypothetical protein
LALKVSLFHESRLPAAVTLKLFKRFGGRVKHFNEAQWADFARNLLPSGERTAMQEHLDSGCKECADELRLWQEVSTFAKDEFAVTPPEGAVRIAKSHFAATPQTPGRVRLVFDSLLQPAMEGVRGAAAARQFLFETDKFYIDLRLDVQTERLMLVGQIMNRSEAKLGVQDLPVHLHKGKLLLADTGTNQFGEFQFEVDASAELSISISAGSEDPIFLPLYGIYGKPLKPGGTA